MVFTAIILAGDRTAEDPHAHLLPGRKALLPMAGQPMISYVLSAIEQSQQVTSAIVVANRVQEISMALQRSGTLIEGLRFVEGAASPVASVQKLLAQESVAFPLLIVTADSPLLTSEEIDLFCVRVQELKPDAAVAVGEKSRLIKLFPDAQRTWIPLRGESYHGCNLFALCTPHSIRALNFWRGVELKRKSALKLAMMLGFKMFVGVLLRTASLAEAFRTFSQSLNLHIVPLSPQDIRIAIDVDKPADAKLAEKILRESRR